MNLEGLVAYHNNIEYNIPVSKNFLAMYSIANTSNFVITPNGAQDNNLYVLNPDGTVTSISLFQESMGYFNHVQMNDEYILISSVNDSSNHISSTYCPYIIIDNAITCDTPSGEPIALPYHLGSFLTETEDWAGVQPSSRIGVDNELLLFYMGYQNAYAAPILFNLETNETRSLSNIAINELRTTLGNDYIDAISSDIQATIEEIPSPEFIDALITPELESAILDTVTLALALASHPNYVETGEVEIDLSNATTPNDYLIGFTSESTYFSNNSIKTPLVKYSLQRDVEVSGVITLPGNFKPEAGINVTLADNDGNIITALSDANGLFTITNPTSDNYEITFSYPQHVFECANIDITSGSFGEFEMLAGDFNDDGVMNYPDWLMFRDRVDHPTVDFDINNDGIVNYLDKEMLLENRLKRQCDL